MDKGMSGGPKTRPKESRNRAVLTAQALLDARAVALAQEPGATACRSFWTQFGKTGIAHAAIQAGAENFLSIAVIAATSLLDCCCPAVRLAVISL